MYGFGIFLAFQILVDLTYSTSEHGNSSILPFSNDEWAIAGPGAKRGISMLLKDGIKADELKVMFWLRTNQRQEFRRLGLDFSYLVDRDGHEKEISLSNIENCLCEFYKYLKLREANGKVKRRFIPIYSDALGRWMSDSFSRGAPNDYNSK